MQKRAKFGAKSGATRNDCWGPNSWAFFALQNDLLLCPNMALRLFSWAQLNSILTMVHERFKYVWKWINSEKEDPLYSNNNNSCVICVWCDSHWGDKVQSHFIHQKTLKFPNIKSLTTKQEWKTNGKRITIIFFLFYFQCNLKFAIVKQSK